MKKAYLFASAFFGLLLLLTITLKFSDNSHVEYYEEVEGSEFLSINYLIMTEEDFLSDFKESEETISMILSTKDDDFS